MTRPYRFRRGQRIRSRRDFRRIFQQRCVVADPHLVVYTDRNDRGHPRLGIVASRRLGKAVARNRQKRRLREAFRLCQHDLPPLDLICVLRSCEQSVSECRLRLLKLAADGLRKLERRSRKRNPTANPTTTQPARVDAAPPRRDRRA